MADSEYAPGVDDEGECWGGHRYVGTREALIAAGLAQAAWFPGEPGQGKTAGWGELHGRRVHVQSRGRLFRCTYRFTAEEHEQYLAENGLTEPPPEPPIDPEALALGVIVQPFPGATVYFGTKEQLIAEGICTEAHFPVPPKRTRFEPGGEGWQIERKKGGIWRFWKCTVGRPRTRESTPKGEREPYYQSTESWRARIEELAEHDMGFVEALTSGELERLAYGETTIRYDEVSLNRIRATLRELESALRCGTVVWVGNARRVRGQLPKARADAAFQVFLRRAAGDGTSGE